MKQTSRMPCIMASSYIWLTTSRRPWIARPRRWPPGGHRRSSTDMIASLGAACGSDVIVNKVHDSFCEIAHAASGKGNALKYLAGRLGIPQSQTVAIGDSPNDVSMLRWAGLGIVVGDASDEVRAAADWVIDHETGDGFCEAVARAMPV